MYELYKKGFNKVQISKQLEVNEDTVRKYLTKKNLTFLLKIIQKK